MTPERAAVVARLADLACQRSAAGAGRRCRVADHPARVAVDGVTASSKTTLASEICAEVASWPSQHLAR
jgi:hypothetical protein